MVSPIDRQQFFVAENSLSRATPIPYRARTADGRRRIPGAPGWSCLLVVIALTLVWTQPIVFAQTVAGKNSSPGTGRQLYRAACLACHGPDGKGQPQSTLGFEPPATFPDFTDCSSASREPDSHWIAMVHEGGRIRGFSTIMPAFGDALTAEQISQLIGYLRSLCTDSHWPLGNFNFPRPLVTEKAFPEDEVVLTTAVNATGLAGISQDLVIEKRFGARNNLEVTIPGALQKRLSGSWDGGIGDIGLQVKRTMLHSNRRGSIFSFAGEIILPTGDSARGFGRGSTFLESFAAYGQVLPSNSFLQIQAGAETPFHRHQEASELYFRTTLGRSFSQNHGLGRTWTPMVEMISARELVPGQRVEWDVLPEIQVTLSKRQHIRFNIGTSVPFSNTAGRSTQVVFYFLWDWYDGGLRDGWR